MSAIEMFPEACRTVAEVVARSGDAELDRPTPCTGFDLRGLVNHAAGTTGALARAGAGQALDPDDPWGGQTDVTGGDWSGALTANLGAIADGWSRPEAWAGMVDTGGHEMPARFIGEMALVEVMLHGWDLACATGQDLLVSPELGREVRRVIEETAELGRQMEAYGPAVAVVGPVTDFDQALATAGRDPRWTA